ncbi:MAG: glycoside hydrolase family 140 protein [Bacteroidales bacterium]|nr:glycoside hydrolase family 140 protein [Bacteroidales bacterium]
MKNINTILPLLLIFVVISLLSLTILSCRNRKESNQGQDTLKTPERLRVSHVNPHLFETESGIPVFLNNYTAWQLIKNGSCEEIAEFISICKSHKFNMISTVLLTDNIDVSYYNDTSVYGKLPFLFDSHGNPDPLRPDITQGNDPNIPKEYDYWDHVDYIIDIAAINEMYISLHPTWGKWVSGGYSGPTPDDQIVFNKANAYKYGVWLGQRYASKDNILWMIGGDRSAIYELKDGMHDFREVWRAMAEGLADGSNGIDKQDGSADYSNLLISFHPRKWAPNSSEWFHKDEWLAFNSIQDTPYDQIVSISYDYNLIPHKPSWLFEGRYEGATSAWAVRYQAYQTVFAGGCGNTYGSENWQFPSNWREIARLPGAKQMAHLYTVARKIWTDAQFLDRMPDQKLIVGDQGDTKGDGMTVGDGDGGPSLKKKANATSNRITAIRGANGKWAMVYSANGRNITLNLTHLYSGKMDAYWYNPRNGKWRVIDEEFTEPTPFISRLITGNGNHTFEAPGIPGPDNDWVLILK